MDDALLRGLAPRVLGVLVRRGADFAAAEDAVQEALVDAWTPLTLAVNSLNRSMGLADLYPFVLSTPVITKLGFVHDLIASAQTTGRNG